MRETLPDGSSGIDVAAGTPVPDSLRVQILATEHWGQLATRSMLWNEIFSRVGMFLTILSAAVVGIALVAQASDFGSEFRLFSLLVLPMVLFVGIATQARISQSVEQEVWTVVGMNRLRHAYVEMAPDIETYLINSHYDDVPGLLQSSGWYTTVRPNVGMFISATPVLVAVINSVITGVIVAIVIDAIGGHDLLGAGLGVAAGFSVMGYMTFVVGRREVARLQTAYVPKFPRSADPNPDSGDVPAPASQS